MFGEFNCQSMRQARGIAFKYPVKRKLILLFECQRGVHARASNPVFILTVERLGYAGGVSKFLLAFEAKRRPRGAQAAPDLFLCVATLIELLHVGSIQQNGFLCAAR